MTRRYPIDDLLQLTGLSMSQLQHRAGFGGTEYRRYQADGVSPRVADRLAVRCGFHPGEVWPSWLEDAEADRKAAAAAAERRRYRKNPAAARARSRSNYAEGGDYIRSRERRKYWADPESARARRRARYERNAEHERAARRKRYAAAKAMAS